MITSSFLPTYDWGGTFGRTPNSPTLSMPAPVVYSPTPIWGTKRKYGERASSCASSAGSMDSRLSENFERLDHGGYRSTIPLPPPVPLDPLRPNPPLRSLRRHESQSDKRPRKEPLDDRVEAESTHHGSTASLPGPRNTRTAYVKTRAAIKAYLKTVPPELIDQSSSCVSILVDAEEGQATDGRPNTSHASEKARSLNLEVLSRMRMAVVKWQSRKQFFEFTSVPQADEAQSTAHAWRRRRTLAEQLLSTSSKGNEWAALVARRFTKTSARQIAGLRAILRLLVEEESHKPETIPQFNCARQSDALLELIFIRSQPTTLLASVVSSFLGDWPLNSPWAIRWLVTAVPNIMTNVDGGAMMAYGQQAVQDSAPWECPWLDGLWLLWALISPTARDNSRIDRLSVSKLILHVGMQAFGTPVPNGNETSEQWVLHCVLSTCFNCDGVESLPTILPSAIILGPFVEACVNVLCANGPLTCFALKALALLRNFPTGMERLLPHSMSALSSSCMNIVLGGGFWDKFKSLDECGPNSFNLIPEEDAFDILCRLPRPTFSTALAAVLDNCPVSLDPSSQDHLKLFDILEPLLWLSNMPASTPEAHRALVEGGACEFLVKVILDSPREIWSWEDRAAWRVKGEAITCLGNIIEKMDHSTLCSHLRGDVIEAIADIRDNMEAPLAQRDQATFTLLRYKAAAGRYDVEPLCKERLAQEPVDPNGEEDQRVRAVSNAVPAISAVTGEAS